MSDPFGKEPGFGIRALEPERHFAAWLRLIHAVETDQLGSVQTNEESLRQALNWPRVQRWVVESPEAPGELIGYAILFAQTRERSALDLMVHPHWRRRGIGSGLLAHLISAAQSLGAERVNFELEEHTTPGKAFLLQRGFRMVGDAWVLRAPAEADFAEPEWPAGYHLHTLADLKNIHILAQACNRGYSDMWGHSENTAGGVNEDELAGWMRHWDPAGVFIVLGPDGQPVATSRVRSGQASGDAEDLIDGPGVAPEHRPLLLQRPLIQAAAHWLRAQGRRPILLESWGDPVETVNQYQQLGFALVRHDLALCKEI